MRRRQFVPRRKFTQNNIKIPSQQLEQTLINPQINAQCSLLEISQEYSKILEKSNNNDNNFRSYSTEFFKTKKYLNEKNPQIQQNIKKNDKKIDILHNNLQLSVTKKSTHSTQMRKTTSLHLKTSKSKHSSSFYQKNPNILPHNLTTNPNQNQCNYSSNNNNSQYFNRTNKSFFSFICTDGKLNNKFQNVFNSKPSKNLVELLKRTNFTRSGTKNRQNSHNNDIVEDKDKNIVQRNKNRFYEQKNDDKIIKENNHINSQVIPINNPRKKSLFRFKNLIAKSKGQPFDIDPYNSHNHISNIHNYQQKIQKIDQLNIKMLQNTLKLEYYQNHLKSSINNNKNFNKNYFTAVIRIDKSMKNNVNSGVNNGNSKKQLNILEKNQNNNEKVQIIENIEKNLLKK